MNEPLPASAPYKDRYGGLVAFGILELLLGACCSLMLPLTLVNVFLSRRLPGAAGAAGNAATAGFGLLVYGGLAVFFVTIGIGSLRARRWARTLMLVAAWMWLVSGLLGLVF